MWLVTGKIRRYKELCFSFKAIDSGHCKDYILFLFPVFCCGIPLELSLAPSLSLVELTSSKRDILSISAIIIFFSGLIKYDIWYLKHMMRHLHDRQTSLQLTKCLITNSNDFPQCLYRPIDKPLFIFFYWGRGGGYSLFVFGFFLGSFFFLLSFFFKVAIYFEMSLDVRVHMRYALWKYLKAVYARKHHWIKSIWEWIFKYM